MGLPVHGGSPSLLAPGIARGVATDDTHVYWTDVVAGTLSRMPLEGGAAETLADDLYFPWAITVDANSVYLVLGYESSAVLSVSKNGGTPETLASSVGDAYIPWSIAVDDSSVYWADYGGRLLSAPKGGGNINVVASNGNYFGITKSHDRLYAFRGEGTSSATLVDVPLDGSNEIVLASLDHGAVGTIAVDAEAIYFTNGMVAAGTVASVSRNGGAVDMLATEQDVPAGIADDEEAIYWVTAGGAESGHGKVMRRFKDW
jgi:sugar lactone lactonase YvrE